MTPLPMEKGFANAQPYSAMDHPLRTLLYGLLVEPLLRLLQRLFGSSA